MAWFASVTGSTSPRMECASIFFIVCGSLERHSDCEVETAK